MNDSWDDRRKAQEEAYFDRVNKEAMNRIKARGPSDSRKSPITGEPMEQITAYGVVLDRCPTSGGVWLDAGELEQIIKAAEKHKDSEEDWVSSFFTGLFGKK